MEQHRDEEHHQWVEEEEEEVEEAALEGRKSQKHLKDNLITSVTVPSSSSSSSSSSSPTTSIGVGHTNCVSSVATDDPDRPLIQKEEEVAEMANISENGSHSNGDNAAVGLGLVAGFVGAATNEETISSSAFSPNKNSVYFDKQEGKWKCHHCSWTKQFDSPRTIPIKENSDLLMNIKTMIQHGPCFICETKGSEAINAPYGVQNSNGASSVLPTHYGMVEDPDIPNSLSNGVNNQYTKPLHDSSEIIATGSVEHLNDETNDETSAKAGPKLIEEIDQQLNELDVEAVLAKQETHDLFCPNCNSCITKRVILKKRKRHIHNLDPNSKRYQLDTIVSSKLVDSSRTLEDKRGDYHAISSSAAAILDPQADDNPEQEPEVFRCLSCFSIFIPRGNGFNLFWKFGGAREPDTSQSSSSIPASNLQNSSSTTISNVQNSSNITVSNVKNPSNVPASNANWFFWFISRKGKTDGDHGKASHKHPNTGPAEQDHSSSIPSNMLTSPENGNLDSPVTGTTFTENGKPMPDIKPEHGGLPKNMGTNVGEENNDLVDIKKRDTVANLPSMKFSGDVVHKHERDHLATAFSHEAFLNAGEPAKDDILKPREREPDFLVPSNVGSKIVEKSQKDIDKTPEIVSAVLANGAATKIQSSGADAKIPLQKDLKLNKKVEEQIKPSVSNENRDLGNNRKYDHDAGRDVILLVEEDTAKATTSQTADTVPVEGAILAETANQVYVGEQSRAEIGEPREWEILKSIVYGGLIESITSLGIVSSSAGAGAAPLNIIALGLANLIGGLFLIGHNLLELKNDKSEDLQQMNMKEDRYQELLGRRANFLLHAVVTVLSFLIFGSVPIVIYGILIRKNYYAEVKLAAVAATSLACIILLATGKVYTKRPPKSYSKTVFYYVTMALAASGVSYIVGGVIKDLLEKFSQSESGFVITMPFSGTRTMESAWSSY